MWFAEPNKLLCKTLVKFAPLRAYDLIPNICWLKLNVRVTLFNQVIRICYYVAAAGENHSKSDCFGVALITSCHNGMLSGVDTDIYIKTFVQPIRDCRTLVGKPKIFIIVVREQTAGFFCYKREALTEPYWTAKSLLKNCFRYKFHMVENSSALQ